MRKKIFLASQYLVPQHALSRFAGWLANSRRIWLKNYLIRGFLNKYPVNLQEAVNEDINAYHSYNDFFTRPLKSHLRPIAIDENTIVSPADGTIAQIGDINKNLLIQAKNFDFDLQSLLGGDADLADKFHDGKFTTIYLAPHNYHRVHSPLAGKLIKTIYIPGKLFSVNQTTADYIPQLYSRNERLVCLFETAAGLMAVIFVGAMIVGNIKTVWSHECASYQKVTTKDFSDEDKHTTFAKGDEIGHFQLGSTVILLFGHKRIEWSENMNNGQLVQFGEAIGNIL